MKLEAETNRAPRQGLARVWAMTARARFPRTLVEAWPQHYAWRGVIVRYRRPLAERVMDVLCASAIGVAGAAALVHWWCS